MMNDLILCLYLIDIVSSIAFVLCITMMACIAILFFICIYLFWQSYNLSLDDVKHITNKYCKPIVIALISLSITLAIIPSKQTMYIALGLHTANQALQQPQMVEVGNQAMRILQMKLDEYEKELTKTGDEK